ncbi:MAG: hypothetical protein AAGA11_07605 [Pseudomonadota bacterium]
MHMPSASLRTLLLTGALQTMLLHQLYAVRDPFLEIENHTPDTTVTINGDRFVARQDGRLAVPCYRGETLKIRWGGQETHALCRTRLYLGL